MADFAPPPVQAPEATPYLPAAATPDAFGAPIGAAAEQAGAMQQAGVMDARRILLNNQYDADLSAAQVRAAQLRPQMQAQIAAIQGDPDLKLPEYGQRVSDAFDSLAGSVTDGITNTKIARIMSAQVSDMKASYATEAGQWQTVQTAGQAVGQLGYLQNTLAAQADANMTPDGIGKLQQQYADTVHLQAGLTPDQRSQITMAGMEKIPLTYASALAYSDDPTKVALAYHLYQSGWFEKVGVKADALRQNGRMVDSRMAHMQAQVQATANADTAGFTVKAEQTIATVTNGGNVPMPDLANLAAEADARAKASQDAGKPKPELFTLATRLHEALQKADVNGRYAMLPPAQLNSMAQTAQADIARKRAAGQPVSLDDGVHAQALADLAQRTIAAVNSDPWSLAAQRGVAPAPLNPADPNTYHQRTMQAQQLQQVLGLPYPVSPLQKSEAEQLAKQAGTGEAGRQQVLAQIDHFDMATRDVAARQILPRDGTFVIEAGLDPGQRGAVQQGKERLSANPQFWNAKLPNALPGDKAPALAHLSALDARVDAALGSYFSQTDIAGVKATARNWIAGQMVGQGKSDGHALTDNDVQNGLRVALGGHVTSSGLVTGGIGSWGAPNNVYLIPPSVNAPGFEHWVTRQVTQDRAQGRGPVNPDGTPFNLTQAKPVFIGQGRYRWDTPAGVVMMPGSTRHAPQPYITRMPN